MRKTKFQEKIFYFCTMELPKMNEREARRAQELAEGFFNSPFSGLLKTALKELSKTGEKIYIIISPENISIAVKQIETSQTDGNV